MARSVNLLHPASWRAALTASWRANGGFIVTHLVVALTVCLFMVWLGRRVGWGALYFFTDFREREHWEGLMTLVSAGGFAFGSWGLLLVGRLQRLREPSAELRRAWYWGALGLAVLAFDDLAMVHEWWAARLQAAGVPRVFGDLDHDIWIVMAYAFAAAVVGWRLLPSILARSTAVAPLVLAVALFAASQTLDFIPWDGLTRAQQEWIGPAEEILKTLGSWCVGLFGLLLAEAEVSVARSAQTAGS